MKKAFLVQCLANSFTNRASFNGNESRLKDYDNSSSHGLVVKWLLVDQEGPGCISTLSLSVYPLRFKVIDKALEHAGLKQLQRTQIKQFKVYFAVLHLVTTGLNLHISPEKKL